MTGKTKGTRGEEKRKKRRGRKNVAVEKLIEPKREESAGMREQGEEKQKMEGETEELPLDPITKATVATCRYRCVYNGKYSGRGWISTGTNTTLHTEAESHSTQTRTQT